MTTRVDVNALRARLAALNPRQREVLEQRLRAEGIDLSEVGGIPSAGDRPSYPLSFAQQRIWFLEQLAPGSTVYVVPMPLRLRGRLDVEILRRCLAEITARHAALRTTFPAPGGTPVQAVAPPSPEPLEIPVHDLTALPAEEREREAGRLLAAEAWRPFDLEAGPLLRVVLVRRAADDHDLLLTLHHIIADHWSVELLMGEVARLYEAFSRGLPSPLPALPVQYPDFAVWQRERLAGELLERELAYWRERLADPPPPLPLPADRPHPAARTYDGGAVDLLLPSDLVQPLRDLARREGATLYMVLLAAFEALLVRLTGREDLIVGTPTANRTRAELEGLIGCFINTLALRTGLAGDPPFREALQRVREAVLGAQAHQEIPFEQIVAALQPERHLDRAPFFQTMFVLQTAPRTSFELPGLTLSPVALESRRAELDLSFSLFDSPRGLEGPVEYSGDLFEAATVVRLLGHFKVLLQAVGESPAQPLSALPLLTAAERRQLLFGWNPVPGDAATLIVEALAERARRTPEALAVVCEGGRLTFAGLEASANRLARRLRVLGVRPDTAVGVCLERSPLLPMALLAVMKAGGAWLPLDPALPRERMAGMLADAEVKLVITEPALAESLPAGGASLLVLDPSEALTSDAVEDEFAPIHPESLAYVIYTSGSTGRPKGVGVPHRALANHAAAAAARYGLTAEDRVLQFTSLGFDVLAEEVFPTWLAGGAVVLRAPGLFPEFDELGRLIESHGVTVANLPTAYWHEWVGAMRRSGTRPPAPLRLVIVGTEQALPERLAEWWELTGGAVRWINGYGATESTVTALACEAGAETVAQALASRRVPVGAPLANNRVYVLDARLQPVPVGVEGDLWVGGPQVARGYLGRPELTAASFAPDPFAAAAGCGAGQRLYKLGDRGRRLPSGEIECLGRSDRQVKIRGFRVETGEIEAALVGRAGVRQAVVDAREVRPGDRRLIAWVVPELERQVEAAELRAALSSVLQEAMIPEAFVVLDALPLTPNGKVDLRALPEPAGLGAPDDEEEEDAAPSDPIEEALAGIFAAVLGRERAGARTHFFRAGGHSLLATQAATRVREAFGVDLPLRSIFEHPTVAGLAVEVRRLQGAKSTASAPRLAPSPLRTAGGPYPLSFAQERLWFLDQLEPGCPAYNIPSAVRLSGRLDPQALRRALATVVARHESLRTSFPVTEGRAVQAVAPSYEAPLPVIDLVALPQAVREAEAERLARAEARFSFDLSRLPLLRAVLLREAVDEHLLVVTVHHIVSDGWSMGVFQRELATAYAAYSEDRAPLLPELPLQYADFADWQRRWLSGDVLAEQLAYWRQRLDGLPVLQLRGDRPRPPVQTFRGGRVPVALSAPLASGLAGLAHARGASLYMVLLAAFETLLHRLTGQEDFAVGTFIANRNRAEVEGLIGFFVNNLALRADLSGDPGLGEMVGRSREVTLGAYAHQDLPFEKLIEELRPERDMSRSSLFQVMCVLLNAPTGATHLPGLTLSELGGESLRANFDLTLDMAETAAGLIANLEYNADLFDAGTGERLAGHLERLLAAAVAEPQRPISTLPILSEAERAQLAVWSQGAPRAEEECIHELFEAQVERTPEATVVVGRGERLTYRALNARANRLARTLRRLGVGPEVRVGICLERSPSLVAAVLGTLKAGGCYLPLDPAYAPDRLAFMLEDAGVSVVLTSAEAAGSLPTHLPAVRIEEIQETSDDGPLAPSGVRPWNLAYVIYTSGSTGRPKGAMVEHRSLVNAYRAWEASYRLREDTTAHLQMASFSFDVFGGDLVRALCSGAKLVLCPREILLDPESLYGLMIEEGVDAAEFVPAVVRGLADLARRTGRDFSFMRLMIVGSDVWYNGELRELAKLCGERTRLIDSYGAAEATIDSTFYEPGPALHSLPAEGLVPIGRPFAGSEVHVLDRHLEPVPVGVPGELCIAGVNLARGYLARPDLTAARFAPHPASPVPGARIYRTGDLARWLPSGDIEFLGRVDHQVKVRGVRMEPGEIEAALGEHPAVRQAVVLAVPEPDRPGEKRLVAYVVPSGDGEPAPALLRAFLKAKLPEPMVPSAFVTLEALPLTANGKVDRRNLTDRPIEWVDGGEASAAPRTPVEELLAGAWAQVLRLPAGRRVGIHDSFFDLGGHSLLATQLVSRVRGACGVELPLRALFEAPTVAGLARRVEALLQEAGGDAAPAMIPPTIGPRPAGTEAPLSFAQQRLWVLDQMEPGNPFYNLPTAVRVEGELDAAVLAASLGEIVRRHEALRTVFPVAAGQPRPVVLPAAPVSLPRIDLRALPEDLRQGEARRLAQEEAQRPFDLAAGPLLRAALVVLGGDERRPHPRPSPSSPHAPAGRGETRKSNKEEEAGFAFLPSPGDREGGAGRGAGGEGASEHLFLATLHHIVSDGWSTQILIGELAALYDAFSAGRPSPLPELPVQYGDFAAWQRGWLQGEVLERQIAWWRERMTPLPAVLELPADRPRPPVQTHRGAHLPVAVPAGLSRALAELGARTGATSFMTLLAAFQGVLARYAGQDGFAVGTPIANRHREEVEGLIGFFVNTLALRADLTGDPSFAEAVARVREAALGAYAHQDLPFDKLVEVLRPERDPSRSPLFQVMFVLQNAPPPSFTGAGLSLTPLEVETGTAKFDLGLELFETADGLRGIFEVDTSLFDPATVERLSGHFLNLLAAVVEDPAMPLAAVPLLSGEERRQILVEWNGGGRKLALETGVLAQIEERAAIAPEAVAVEGADGSVLTYGALDERANALAHRLRGLGAGPEVPVAVVLDRSPEQWIAVLAVWKAGAVYLPLDPEQPRERLDGIIEDAGARIVLTGEDFNSSHPEARNELKDLGGRTPQNDLAYVIYTSGSTGRPKGVMVSHRGLAGLISDMVERLGVAPGDRVAQVISVGFDASLLEGMTALTSGATLVVAGRDERLPGAGLQRWLREKKISCWVAVPSALAATPSDGLPALRAITSGAERLSAEIAARWIGGRTFINCYGPTETTILVTVEDLSAGVPADREPSIGRPVSGVRVHLLDGRGAPVPVGVAGELLVGGAAVARGYLGRPDLTAERFVPDPFVSEEGPEEGGEPGGRLYRTGDLARYLPDGTIEFLGRADRQVKLRGFRVEPGEIEAALESHPAVAQAAVMVVQGVGGPRLAGYAVPREGQPAAGLAGVLRAALRERLPEYMVPSDLVILDRMPLTSTGKIDRRALPEPAAVFEEAVDEPASTPRTPVAEVVAAVWADLLGRERVGARDGFFELGGHSLLAAQAVSRLRDAFGVELPLRALFESPTPEALAAVITEALQGGEAGQAPPLVPVPRDRDDHDLPLSFAQQRLWLLDRLAPGSSAYNLPFALRLSGPLDVEALRWSLGEIVRRHEALRTTFEFQAGLDGKPVQRILPPTPFALPQVDLSALSDEAPDAEQQRLAEAEALRPFDLEHGPVMRCALLRLASEQHAVLCTLHHIAADGWSLGVLTRELSALYAARCEGQPSPLPELPLQYADFAVWQTEWLQGAALDAQLAFWREALAGAPAVLDLPLDRPRTAVRSMEGGSLPLRLPAETAAALRALGRRQGATPFMVLLAAFQALLYRLTRQDDLLVGVPLAGRNRSEVEDLIGFFINTLVLRGHVTGGSSLAALAAQARSTALAAYAHQDLPFEKLVDELRIERSLSHNPLFQVVFALQNTPSAPLDLAGLRWSPLPAGTPAAQFDLSLSLSEEADGLTGSFEYAAALFDRTTIARFALHLETLLAAAAAEPDRPLDELPLLTAAQRHQVEIEWGGAPAVEVDQAGGTVLDVLAKVAAETPDAPAVLFEGASLTHGELHRRVNQVARRLRSLGVAGGTPVGVCLERDLDLPAAILGAMAAGGAFLPLDPTFPAARLEMLLRDSGAAALVTKPGFAEEAAPEVPRLVLDAELLASCPPSPGEREGGAGRGAGGEGLPAASDPAYFIYTSGTTGQPKAVVVEHGSLLAMLSGLREELGLRPGDSGPCGAPFSFDIFLEELLTPLLGGGAVELLARPALDLEGAADAFERADFCFAVPSLLRQIAATLRQRGGSPSSRLRWVLSGGEAVPADLIAEVAEVLPQARLCVLYGPTEATIFCTGLPVPQGAAPRGSLLGRAMPGVELRLVDPAGHSVPAGVAGELWVGGAGLARGYHGRPELTPERFVVAGGERFFRTGDLARWLPDGVLEFLGRADHQVKVRGYRIEPGEVEEALAAHPAVHEAVVVAHGEGGARRLVAYLAGEESGPSPSLEELRRHLAERLPEYMIPSVFIPLPSLPRTAHGKVDRRALPEPGGERLLTAETVAPRTALEEVLAGMWAEILGVEQVGVRDDFFALGGHSLLATQLLAWVRDSFQAEVPLRRVFEQPTVEGLAAALAEETGSPEGLERAAELLLEMAAMGDDEVETLLEKELA